MSNTFETRHAIYNNVVCATSKTQISLGIRAVRSEPLLVARIFYDCQANDRTSFGVSNAEARLSLHLSKCHIIGNHMARLISYLIFGQHSGDIYILHLEDNAFIRVHCIYYPASQE